MSQAHSPDKPAGGPGPKLALTPTADGSYTLHNPQLGAHYHSLQGAWGETQYVFLQQSGLQNRLQRARQENIPVRILEVGVGTGLNLAGALQLARETRSQLDYRGYEPSPVPLELVRQVWPAELHPWLPILDPENPIQQGPWGRVERCTEKWTAQTQPGDFRAEVIFYDAFAQAAAPELWTEESLRACLQWLAPGGIWVSYAATGAAKRAAKSLGLAPEKRKGFGTKRELLVVHGPQAPGSA